MKETYKVIFIVLLTVFSFYYTNQVINIIRNTDPIMKSINKNSDKFTLKSINASIEDDYIIPGKKGIKIDNNKSYSKMKNYGKYNENLLVFKEEEPSISVDNIYDKFIISGNHEKREVALVFIVRRDDNIDRLVNILNTNNIEATFFMDGLFIENNQDLISELVSSNFEIEILSYNGNYSKKEFSKVIDILSEITIPKYCYAPYSDKEILNVCSSLSLHTIIPSINTTSNSYNDIKKKITNGSIISLQNKDYVLNELGTIIKYIKQKGYDIVTLDELLDESIIETTQE